MNALFRITTGLGLGLCLFLLSAQAQPFAHAGEYMDYISADQAEFQKDLWGYIRTAAHSKNARRIERKRADLLRTTMLIRRKVGRLQPYEGDASLRDAVADYYKLVYNILNEDYAKIVDMEEIAEQSYDLMEAYILTKEKANEKLDEASDMLTERQETFAENHQVRLIEGKQSQVSLQLQAAGKVSKYYNRVYLIFFKAYKQEAYLMEALENNDLNALVQNKNALASFAREGLANLDTLSAFKGDASLKEAAQDLLVFYLREADESAPVMMDYYLKKEEFEKIKAIVDTKSAKDRTQEDINQYNASVEAFNQAVNDFNATNEALNAQRGGFLDTWNKSAARFMDRHVPN